MPGSRLALPGCAHRDQEDLHALALVSMAARDVSSRLALSICIWAHSLVLRTGQCWPGSASLQPVRTASPARPAPLPQENRHTCRKVNILKEKSHDSLPPAHLQSKQPWHPCHGGEMQRVEVVPGRASGERAS